MNRDWSRRDFVRSGAACAAGLATGARIFSMPAQDRGADPSPLRGRFLTHVSVVRVNQIEVTPTRNIGEDEAAEVRWSEAGFGLGFGLGFWLGLGFGRGGRHGLSLLSVASK